MKTTDTRHEVSLYLTVTEAGLEIQVDGKTVAAAHSADDLSKAVDAIYERAGGYRGEGVVLNIQGSSSLDFPKEYTTDPQVIAMCRELRQSK